MTNPLFTAAEALSWGMIDEVVSSGTLMERARQLAGSFIGGPTGAYRRMKTLLSEASTNSYERHLSRERTLMIETADDADVKEGITAFLEKRSPAFRGR